MTGMRPRTCGGRSFTCRRRCPLGIGSEVGRCRSPGLPRWRGTQLCIGNCRWRGYGRLRRIGLRLRCFTVMLHQGAGLIGLGRWFGLFRTITSNRGEEQDGGNPRRTMSHAEVSNGGASGARPDVTFGNLAAASPRIGTTCALPITGVNRLSLPQDVVTTLGAFTSVSVTLDPQCRPSNCAD